MMPILPLPAVCLAMMLTAFSASPPAAPDKLPGALSPHSDLSLPIEKALKHIQSRKSNIQPLDLMLLDFLQRKFELDPAFSFQYAYFRVPPAAEKEKCDLYRRLIDPDSPTPVLPKQAPVFVRTDLMALYCRDGLMPPDFFDRLRFQQKTGGYALTHAALALQWVQDLDCLPDLPEYRDLRESLARDLLRLAQDQQMISDVGLEALAFLCYLGEQKKLPRDVADTLRNAQRVDGSFAGRRVARPDEFNDHATLLGLWIFLELQHPGQAHVPMMRLPKE